MLDELDRHDCVRTLRDDTAGRDRHRLTRCQSAARGSTGGNLLDDRQGSSDRHVGGAHREAVHRRARERRQIDLGRRRVGKHPPGRSLDRDALGGERPHAFEDQAVRLADGDQVWHGAVR